MVSLCHRKNRGGYVRIPGLYFELSFITSRSFIGIYSLILGQGLALLHEREDLKVKQKDSW